MKRLFAVRMPDFYGTGFFDDKGVLIAFIHENDGGWRREYLDPIIEFFDGKIHWMRKITGDDVGTEGIDIDPWKCKVALSIVVRHRIMLEEYSS